MVEYRTNQLDSILHALADPTRRAILRRLARQELSIGELAEPHQMSFAAISKHIKVLESADFIRRTKEGRSYICRANLEPLGAVSALLEELGGFWRERLEALDKMFLITTTTGEDHAGKRKK